MDNKKNYINPYRPGAGQKPPYLDGSTSSVYFVQGSSNPFQITNIAAGGDSSGFVALYNQ